MRTGDTVTLELVGQRGFSELTMKALLVVRDCRETEAAGRPRAGRLSGDPHAKGAPDEHGFVHARGTPPTMDASPADQLNTLGNDLRRSGQTVLADRVDAISRRLVESGRAESAAAEVKTAEQVSSEPGAQPADCVPNDPVTPGHERLQLLAHIARDIRHLARGAAGTSWLTELTTLSWRVDQAAAAIARDIPERRRFNVGDVVRLKGGGRQQLMVEAFGDKNGLVDQVDVCWFAMCGELQSHTFPAELLELVPAWSDGAK